MWVQGNSLNGAGIPTPTRNGKEPASSAVAVALHPILPIHTTPPRPGGADGSGGGGGGPATPRPSATLATPALVPSSAAVGGMALVDTPPSKTVPYAEHTHGAVAEGSGSCNKLFGRGGGFDVVALVRAQPGGAQQHLSAVACLAEHSGLLHNLFVTKEYYPRHKVSLRIYDSFAEQWQVVDVEDKFPIIVNAGASNAETFNLAASPAGDELWSMFLEKAFAKHLGGYHQMVDAVAGARQGSADDVGLLALFRMCTGGLTYRLQYNGGAVQRMDLKVDHVNKSFSLEKNMDVGPLALDAVFEALRTLVHQGAVLNAVQREQDGRNVQQPDTRSFVHGHTYPILSALLPSSTLNRFNVNGSAVRMIQLRNIWGSFAWEPASGPRNLKWQEHQANVARRLKEEEEAFGGGAGAGSGSQQKKNSRVHKGNGGRGGGGTGRGGKGSNGSNSSSRGGSSSTSGRGGGNTPGGVWSSSFEDTESMWLTYAEFWEFFAAIDVTFPPKSSHIYLDSNLAGVCGPCSAGISGMLRFCDSSDDPDGNDLRLVQPLPQELNRLQKQEIADIFLAEEVLI